MTQVPILERRIDGRHDGRIALGAVRAHHTKPSFRSSELLTRASPMRGHQAHAKSVTLRRTLILAA